jgi:hypothetical protein
MKHTTTLVLVVVWRRLDLGLGLSLVAGRELGVRGRSRVRAVHDLRLGLIFEVALAAEKNVQHPAVVSQLHENDKDQPMVDHFLDLVLRHYKAALAVEKTFPK